MAKIYGCDKNVILNYAKEIGYVNENTGKLSDLQKQEIINYYNIKTSNELAKEYNVSRGQITKLWYDQKLFGKDRHTYPFDFKYFEKIDSKDKAYFLGFLAADGNVHERNNKSNCQPIIRLSLNKIDEDILETFKCFVNSAKPLSIRKNECSNYISYVSTLELVSKKMAQDLSQYGIIPNKTYEYSFLPLENDDLNSHFIRGYFDGDGSICISKNEIFKPSSYNVNFSGYKHNLVSIQSYLKSKNIESVFIEDKREYHKYTFGALCMKNTKNIYQFLKYIYADCGSVYLHRKKYKADCFFEAINSNYSNKQNIYNKFVG